MSLLCFTPLPPQVNFTKAAVSKWDVECLKRHICPLIKKPGDKPLQIKDKIENRLQKMLANKLQPIKFLELSSPDAVSNYYPNK